jgi:hypothetical protein
MSKAVQAATFLISIQDVLHSILGRDNNYPY